MERSGALAKVDLEKAKIFAEEVAQRAGKLLLEYSSKIKILEWKDRQDVATNADLESEKLIIEAIEKEYPDHNIDSEERGRIDKKSSYTWIIDPLDGTKEYVRGIPIYNVSLTLLYNGESVLAVVYGPIVNQLFSAIENNGAFLNRKAIKVSSQTELVNSFIYCYLPRFKGEDENEFDRVWQKFARLSKRIYRLRGISDLNLSCSWVAMGVYEAFINLFNPPALRDIAPGLFIARQAGAQVSDLNGKPVTQDFKNGLVVSNGRIHKSLLEVLNES